MPIPNDIDFTAFDTLTAAQLDDLIENDVALAAGTALDNNAVPARALATNAIKLATVSSSTAQSGISSGDVIATGLTATVTVPAGGRSVRVEGYIPRFYCNQICTESISIYNSATVTGSPVQVSSSLMPIANNGQMTYITFEHTPSAGSQSYCIALRVDVGSGSTVLSAVSLSYLRITLV